MSDGLDILSFPGGTAFLGEPTALHLQATRTSCPYKPLIAALAMTCCRPNMTLAKNCWSTAGLTIPLPERHPRYLPPCLARQ